jgi:Outer membrane protein beta-barrel domain
MCSFVIAVLGTMLTIQANAQQRYIGVILGANFANESLDAQPGGVSLSDRTGILAGIQVDRWFSQQWGFSEQLLYAQEGRNENINGAGTGIFYGSTTVGNANIENHNLDFDLLLKKTIWGNNFIRTYVFAGPGVGIFLSGSNYLNITISQKGSANFGVDTTYSMDSIVRTLDFSILFGVGVSVKLNSGLMLFCDASYLYGLTNIFESYGGATYTRDIRIAAGILFPINLPSLF